MGDGTELSRSPSVGSVCLLVGELWKNGLFDLDAVWGGEWDQSRDGYIRWGGDHRRRKGSFGVNVGHPIVTSGDFVV